MQISVIIPTYNRYELLKRALTSVYAQSYQPEEVIVVDDGSSDATCNIKNDFPNIVYIRQENKGVSSARNTGIKKASCQWMAFLDSDDEFHADKLQKQVKFLEKHQDINIVYSNAKSIDYNGNELEEFSSVYQDRENNNSIVLSATELLPGVQTTYFLNILTSVLRTKELINVFKESWRFESEGYMCYYIASVNEKIGFIYDKTVALREAEHYRTAVEDGKIVDWKKRKDIRIRQMFNIYNTLTTLHPESKEKLETSQVQNFLARHLIGQAKASKSISLLLQTIFSCSLFFRKFSLMDTLRLKLKGGKSFG